MRIRNLIRHFLLVISALSLLALAGCSKDVPAEEGIEKAIQTMISAIEQGKPVEAMALVDSGFSASSPHGSLNKFQGGLFLNQQLKRYGELKVHLAGVNIQLDPVYEGQADATAQILVTGGRGLLPQNGRLLSVKSRWISHGSEWQLLKMDWQ